MLRQALFSGLVLAAACSQGDPPPESEPRSAASVALAPTANGPPEAEKTLRVLQNRELTPAIIDVAETILHEHHDEPFGFEVPFELDGQRFVGRVEEHYHPPGGPLRPEGEHVGITVYVFE